MYELVQAGKRTYYMEGYARAGLYVFGRKSVCAIDSGSDELAGRALLKHIRTLGLELRMIINTHSHSDHTGGNAVLKRETGCSIYAPGAEHAIISEQIIAPAFIYGGNPMPDLWPVFVTESTRTERLTDAVLPKGLTVVSLDGHAFSHIGIQTPDNVCFIGDALTCAEVLRQPCIPTLFDVGRTLESFDVLEGMKGVRFVPAHEPMPDDFAETIALNRAKTLEVLELVRACCAEPCSLEQLMKKVYGKMGMSMSLVNYVLTQNTLKAYLTYLLGRNEVAYFFEDNVMLWQTKK